MNAVGYQTSPAGDQVSPWTYFSFDDTVLEYSGYAGTPLRYFTEPREGRLSSAPIAIIEDIETYELCGDLCNQFTSKRCNAFDWDYHTHECLLHNLVEHPSRNVLRRSRLFKYWQRLNADTTNSWHWEHHGLSDVHQVSSCHLKYNNVHFISCPYTTKFILSHVRIQQSSFHLIFKIQYPNTYN